MTRGVKVGVRSVLLVLLSVLLVLLLVPRFQRTLLDPLSRGPSPRAGRSAPTRSTWMARRCSRPACCAFARSRSAGPSLTSWW